MTVTHCQTHGNQKLPWHYKDSYHKPAWNISWLNQKLSNIWISVEENLVPLRICSDEDNIDIAFVSVLFLNYLECAVSMASQSTFELRRLQTFQKLISTF